MKNSDQIIAEFDGWVIDNSFPDKDHVYRLGNRLETKNTFKYRESWQWLMPVYRKFKNALADLHKDLPEHSATHGDMIEVDIHCAVTNIDRKKTYDYLVQGIQWYNDYISKANPANK